MSEDTDTFCVKVKHLSGYRFEVEYDWPESNNTLLDESEPLGEQSGPNATRLLAAATANCLSASLLYCVQKNQVDDASLTTNAKCFLQRNSEGRLRVAGLEVTLKLDDQKLDQRRLKRCTQLFEDYCVVTASIRQGIPVTVNIENNSGELLYSN